MRKPNEQSYVGTVNTYTTQFETAFDIIYWGMENYVDSGVGSYNGGLVYVTYLFSIIIINKLRFPVEKDWDKSVRNNNPI